MASDFTIYQAIVGLWIYLVVVIIAVFFWVTRDWTGK